MATCKTIAAVATAPGRGGVAIVRVSGPEAFAVAERLTGWSVAQAPSFPCCRTLAVRPVTDGGAPLDTAVVLAFRAPHSYTGEDVVEFQCHGGTITPARVLAACFAAGAAAARGGEFTERAFLNGKIDLSQAESVIELVDAKTVRAADDALARLAGVKRTAYRALYDRALALSAELEHALDVDEEELPPGFLSDRAERAQALADETRRAAGNADSGRLLREGALVVLAGPPNAGKSSLLNALVGEDRAIVSATPGTTRDAIETWLDLDGWLVRLVDTAGLRETGDAIEAEGVRRAEALLAKADVVVALDCAIAGALHIHSKCDLDPGDGRLLAVSAKTGAGLDGLRRAIVARLAARAGAAGEDGATASERERALLLEAARALEGGRADDPVLFANAVRGAAEALGMLVGATYSSDLLDSIFSRFCVGK